MPNFFLYFRKSNIFNRYIHERDDDTRNCAHAPISHLSIELNGIENGIERCIKDRAKFGRPVRFVSRRESNSTRIIESCRKRRKRETVRSGEGRGLYSSRGMEPQ